MSADPRPVEPWNLVHAPAVRGGEAGTWTAHSLPRWDAAAGPGWLDAVMEWETPDRFHAKQGRSVARVALSRGGETLVVYLKRHTELPRRGASPGMEEWHHLRWAVAAGVPVARPLAVGEWRGDSGRVQGFLAVEELAGMLALHEAIPLAHARLSPRVFARWKRGLARELARLARLLHDRGAFHQDLYLCHFYVAEADALTPPVAWAGRVAMIDFHRLTRHRFGGAWWRVKDLAQLQFSTLGVAGLTDRDRGLFWKAYRGGRAWGWLRRAAGAKAGRYARHNARRAGVLASRERERPE